MQLNILQQLKICISKGYFMACEKVHVENMEIYIVIYR